MSRATGAGTMVCGRLQDATGSLVDRLALCFPRAVKYFIPPRKIGRDEYEKQLDFYFDGGFVDRPETFFAFSPETPARAVLEKRPYHGGECQLVSWESGYTAANPLIRSHYHSYVRNRTAYLVRWTHGGEGRKTVLCHHGYMMGNPARAEKMFRVRTLFSMGLDVALFIAPFHWRRGAGGLMRRGFYLQPDNVAMTAECVRQDQYDLNNAFSLLSDMGAGATGLIGASMGGYNTALFISLTDRAAFGAMMVPAFNFSRPLGPDTVRLSFAPDDRLREKIRRVWDFHSPLNFRPKIPPDRILVVASRGDLICPFEYVRELCDSWGVRNRRFLNGGHWLMYRSGLRGHAWYRFLADRGFAG